MMVSALDEQTTCRRAHFELPLMFVAPHVEDAGSAFHIWMWPPRVGDIHQQEACALVLQPIASCVIVANTTTPVLLRRIGAAGAAMSDLGIRPINRRRGSRRHGSSSVSA